MKKGIYHDLPNFVTHLLRYFVPASKKLYKEYTTAASSNECKDLAVTINNIINNKYYWKMEDGKQALVTNNDEFIRF